MITAAAARRTASRVLLVIQLYSYIVIRTSYTVSAFRMHLRYRTLLTLPRRLGVLRRELNGPGGRSSGRTMLHYGLCR